MLIWRPCLGGPPMRVEVTLGGTIEGRVLGVLSTVMILNVLKTLSKVFMMVGFTAICLENNMREDSG